MDRIHVLQLGTEDWRELFHIPENVEWTFTPEFTDTWLEFFDVVILDRQPEDQEYKWLQKVTRAYTLFLTERVRLCEEMTKLYKSKCGQILPRQMVQEFLNKELRFFFAESYGVKMKMQDLTVAQHWGGTVEWTGNNKLSLQGDFGAKIKQVACWRNSVELLKDQVLDLWLEYQKDESVELELEVTQFEDGSLSARIQHWNFDEEQLRQVVQVEGSKGSGPLFISLRAKGEGHLQINGLHLRYSRGTHGYLLPGGNRFVTSQREELFTYFDPGDRKPPLNVFFSGYKTIEGFDGYRMMEKLGSPFLLISDSRLEGGGFYLGSSEYESLVEDVIQKQIEELEFSSGDVIFSGLSMGSSGAIYYGSKFEPHAIIVGKPLVNLGSVAANEKWLRPGVFPAALDVLEYLCEDTDKEAIDSLNQRVWNKFDGANWGKTKFVVAYMLEDDYDPRGYTSILEHLQSEGVQVYGKGIHGRQADNTSSVMRWIMEQYRKILAEDFEKRID